MLSTSKNNIEAETFFYVSVGYFNLIFNDAFFNYDVYRSSYQNKNNYNEEQ